MKPDFDALAAYYRTSPRTVRRWHQDGVDVADPLAVARHLVDIQHPGPAFDAAREILETELENELP